ncbi:TPA: hypothetical protein ACH3X2_002362 [Trebouxia sp. C0005]
MLSGLHATCTTCHQARLQPARALVAISQQRILRSDRCMNTREQCVRCPAVATATIAASASLVDATSPSSDGNLSMHPDAIKRRQDAEARKQARQADMVAAKTNSWWEAPGPENLILATTEIMLTDAVQQGKNAGKLVAVKFFAPWCQACKALYPKWMQLAAQNPDVTFIKVNAADDTMRAVAAAMGVTKLPYFHMYMHGQLAKNFTANLHKVSYLKRAIIDCKQCLNPGCH